MKKSVFAAFGVLGLACATAAVAASDGPRGPGARFKHLDQNGDGIVTAQEMDARKAEIFAAADSNGDGGLSEDEMRAFHEAKREEWRKKHDPDANNDGIVDRSEFRAAADARFDRMDKNGDGVLSEDEQRHRRGRHPHGQRGE